MTSKDSALVYARISREKLRTIQRIAYSRGMTVPQLLARKLATPAQDSLAAVAAVLGLPATASTAAIQKAVAALVASIDEESRPSPKPAPKPVAKPAAPKAAPKPAAPKPVAKPAARSSLPKCLDGASPAQLARYAKLQAAFRSGRAR